MWPRSRDRTKLVTVYKAHVDTADWAMTVLRRAGFHPEQLDEPMLLSARGHELLSVIRIAVPRSEARAARRALANVESEAAPRVAALERQFGRMFRVAAGVAAFVALLVGAGSGDVGAGLGAGAAAAFATLVLIGIISRFATAEHEEGRPTKKKQNRRKRRRR
jgi:hypothetical protein